MDKERSPFFKVFDVNISLDSDGLFDFSAKISGSRGMEVESKNVSLKNESVKLGACNHRTSVN